YANSVTLQIGSTIDGNLNVGTNAGSTLTLTDNGNGGIQLYSSAVTGTTTFAGVLIKNGAGTWNLDQAMSYSGGTNVNAGTLLVNNSSGTGTGAVAVNSNATLGGTGTINGPVTVNNTGTLSPGNSPGILHLGSSLTLNNASNLKIEVGGANPGTGYDQVQIADTGLGALTLNTPNLNVSLVNGFTPTFMEKFYILDLTGLGTVTGVFGNAVGGTAYTDTSGNNWLITYNDTFDSTPGNDVSLTFFGMTPIPEPSTWIAGALVCAALAYRSLRKCRAHLR
ncbi:MAG: autotransporter-associated beta strand repeat-containing protein, partial [Verrucomicrobiota bacterium]|nr:autotransporter-associated beta strand repeat-containing protein [Verrucomicrobiota bacterium]